MKYYDFLNDKQFIRWQLAPDEQLENYWADFIIQNPQFEKEINRAIRYLKTTGLNKSSLTQQEKEHLLERIIATIKANRAKARKRVLISMIGVSIAAMLVLVFSLNLFLDNSKQSTLTNIDEKIVGNELESQDIQLISNSKTISFQENIDITVTADGEAHVKDNESTHNINVDQVALNKLVVPFGKRAALTLADGSKVWLNAGSILEFPAQFKGKSRDIHLTSGEMYIEVSKNRNNPFYVHTSNFDVKVYGTAFNLTAYSDAPQSIVLVEGSVSLKSANHKEVFISRDERAVFSDEGSFTTQTVNVDHYIGWRLGYLEFEKALMTDVLRQVGRYYNISFDYDQDVELHKRTCTGRIFLTDNIDHVMGAIGVLTNSRYTREDNQIILINNN